MVSGRFTKNQGQNLKVKIQSLKMKNDLSQRLLNFTINVIKLLRKLPNDVEYKVIKFQLIKSASSTGANYEEAQGASSKADFNNKIHISLK